MQSLNPSTTDVAITSFGWWTLKILQCRC